MRKRRFSYEEYNKWSQDPAEKRRWTEALRIMMARSGTTKSWILSPLWRRDLGGYSRHGCLSLFDCPGYVVHQLFQIVLGGFKFGACAFISISPFAALLRRPGSLQYSGPK
jgi:hypothetical protein